MPSLHCAIAPHEVLSSAPPDPTTVDFGPAVAATTLAAVGFGFGAVAASAEIGAPVAFDVATAPFTPPWPEHAPRPVAVEVVPSAHADVTCVPVVLFTTAFAVFSCAFTVFASTFVAVLSTPPWPEQAPRPDVADVVPSLHFVAVA